MKKQLPVLYAVLAAALYALSTPFSKLLMIRIPPMTMASLLYLGAGLGMLVVGLIRNGISGLHSELPLTRAELPYTLGMISLDIAAPILLMLGLRLTSASNAALLNNFEIVATSLIALLLFKEAIGRRLWFAIGLITLASILLTFENMSSLSFSIGSLLVLAACTCWGLENNCTRMLSGKDPLQIVVIKGFGSGLGALLIALASGERIASFGVVPLALLLGFVAYGLSIFFYVHAQRHLGAARTSAYYAIAPFLGAGLSMIALREAPGPMFIAALLLMLLGAVAVTADQARQDQAKEGCSAMRNHNDLKDFDFGARSASYDKGIEGRLSRRFYRLVLSRIQLPENARVLDAGCGTGALLRMIANRHPIIGFGIDMEPGMIEQARRQCPDMTIQHARCEQTPFEDARFDAMVTCMAYHHFSDKPGFAREAARILKPGGLLYIADVCFPTPIRQTISGILRHRGLAGEFCTPGQITQTFEEHGFVLDGYAKDGLAQLIILKKTAGCALVTL